MAADRAQQKIAHDRHLILRGFGTFAKGGLAATYHEAAVEATKIEGTQGQHFREESLRRRGSDLPVLGLIVQVGRRARRATFILTAAGRSKLGL